MLGSRPRGVLVSSLILLSLVVASSASAQQRVRVGSDVKEPKKIKDVRPVYPEDAKAAGVQGIVIIEALIGTDGAVKEAKVLRSVAMLDAAALEAVIQWRYTPTLLNGEAVELVMTVTVTFTLSEPTAAAAAPTAPGSIRPVFGGSDPTYVAPILQVPPPAGAVRIGGDIPAPKRLTYVAAKFPEGQRFAARDGVMVVLEIVVGTDGRVTDVRVLRPSPPIAAAIDARGNVTDARPAAQSPFVEAAVAAVRQWEYQPTLLNGVPVPIVMTVTVTFTATN